MAALDCLREHCARAGWSTCTAAPGSPYRTVAGCLLVESGLAGKRRGRAQPPVQQSGARRCAQVPETPSRLSTCGAGSVRAARAIRCSSPPHCRRARPAGPLPRRAPRAGGGMRCGRHAIRRPGKIHPRGRHARGGPFDLPRRLERRHRDGAVSRREPARVRRLHARDQVARYRAGSRKVSSCTGQCVGITAGTARAGARTMARQPFSGSHDPEALIRKPVARRAVAMYFFAHPRLPRRAAEAARTTCQAGRPDGVSRWRRRCTRALGEPRPVILARRSPYSMRRCTDAGLRGNTAPAALAAALEAFASTGNFRDAVLSAANLGATPMWWPRVRRARRCALHCKRDPHLVAQQPDQRSNDREQRGSAARPRDAGVHWWTATAA